MKFSLKGFRICVLIFSLIGLFSFSPAYCEEGKVFELSNGLSVFVKPLKTAPVVAINIWIKVGAVNEEKGEEGYAHLIEHMMFKGTPSHPYGSLDNEIKTMGASQNAFTSYDYTCYHVTGAKQHFDKLLELEADAVLNSSFDANELDKEKKVVIEELRMGKDNSNHRVFDLLMAESFTTHPYRHPIVGYINNLEEVTREKLYSFYRKFYVPSNMWVVVVGDVDPDQAFESIKKQFGSAPKVPKPTQIIKEEPLQTSRREVQAFGDIKQSFVRLGWRAPGISNPDNYTMDVITRIVGVGKSSRLQKTLVDDEQIAIAAGCNYYTSQFPSLFIAAGVTTPGNTRKFIERASQIVYEMKNGEISSEEIEKAKQKIIADSLFSNETAEDQATNYGHYATLTSLDDADKYVSRIKAVSIDDIKRVANLYFDDSKLTVATYEPKRPEADAVPVMLTLDNGLRLILKENHSSPIVAVSVKVGAGGLREGKKEAGLGNLTLQLLAKGANKLTAEEIAEKFDAMGTIYSAESSKSFVTLKLQALSEKFIPSLDLLMDILEKPDFEKDEFNKAVKQAIEGLKYENDQLFYSTLYGTLEKAFDGTPLAYPTDGTIKDLEKMNRSDVKEFHKKYYVGSNMVISIVGDFYLKEVKDKLLETFGRISKGREKDLKPFKLDEIKEPVIVDMQKNREQAQIMYLCRTFPDSSEKSLPMLALNNILSGSMSSRLFKNLRAKDSLAYSTWSWNVGYLNAGYFMATLSTAANKVATATKRLKEELVSIRDESFTDKELEDAKKYLIGQKALSLVSNLSQADDFAGNEFFGKGYDYSFKYPKLIASITRLQVETVAKDYILASDTYFLGVTKP